MSKIDPEALATLVRALHGYELGPAGAVRTAGMVASIESALAALAPEPQFYEEPAWLAATLSALAPQET